MSTVCRFLAEGRSAAVRPVHAARLSQLRYQGGMDSYLQVLESERALFQGLSLARLRLEELLSFVRLYRALGAGWQ